MAVATRSGGWSMWAGVLRVSLAPAPLGVSRLRLSAVSKNSVLVPMGWMLETWMPSGRSSWRMARAKWSWAALVAE